MAKILVVDDDQSIVNLLRLMLTHEGFEVATAMDGQQGLAEARRVMPDLIVLDVMMPVMDGFTVSGLLFQDPVMRKIPVIILTAQHHSRNVLELVPNVRIYMAKPFEPADLLQKVKSLLQSQSKAA
jgi:DNA-binding response OmpR family regulator